jgi:hypothetical protein
MRRECRRGPVVPLETDSRLISKGFQSRKETPQMNAAIYARGSTEDKGQDPLNQLAAPAYEPARKPAAHPACTKEVALPG